MPDKHDVFDVRNTFPPDCDMNDPKVKSSIEKINLMVFLLEGITYKTLYSSNYGHFIRGLIPRADAALQAGLISPAQRDELVAAGSQLANVLAGNPITLQEIFTTKKAALPPGLWEPSCRMDAAGVTVTYCRQPDATKELAKAVFASGLLNDLEDPSGVCGIGNITERDLYTLPARKYAASHAMVQSAREAVIMETKPNDMACKWPNCLPYDDLYCAMQDGECTLASDPYPEE